MATVPDARQRVGPRAELGRFLAILGATGLAICQPVLDTFGKSPETIVFRRVDGPDLVVFALLVAFVPAVVLWAAGFAVGRLAPRWRPLVHGATLGALVALAVVQMVGSWSRPIAIATAIALGFGAWVLVVRVSHARLWFQLLAVLPLLAVVLFLTASRASDAVSADGFEGVVGPTTGSAPVVLIVLDELPTASLLDEHGGIDPVRFPNLARLAQDATWYRNHTTTSGWTATAVPAILSGQLPENDTSLFTERPNNVFRLLEGSHDLVVSEAVTRLCPVETCGEAPVAPGGGPAAVAGDLRGLLGDAVDVWRWRVTGAPPRDPIEGFAEQLTDGPAPPPTTSGAGSGPDDTAPADLEPASQPVRIQAFLDAIEPGDRPMAAIIHIVLPHSPWRFLPDGTVYAAPAAEIGDEQDHPNEWVADVRRQQHLLQASYADRLVGQILDKVRAAGFYDDAVVAVTADHGIAFPVDDLGRRYSPANEVEIMWVPLLVKAPHQTDGAVDDSNLENIDILPTIASLAGIAVPWDEPGAAAGSPAIAERGDRKELHRHESILDPGPTVVLEVDGAAGLRRMLDKAYAPVGADEDPVRGLYRLGPRPDLIGRPFTTTQRTRDGAVTVDDRDRLTGDEPTVVVGGSVRDRAGAAVVAVVDGTVVATSPIYGDGGRDRFLLMLPVGPPVAPDRVRLGLVSSTGALLDAGPLTG